MSTIPDEISHCSRVEIEALSASGRHHAFPKTHKMAKQKFRPARLGGFSGAKAYIQYVEILKKRRNAAERTFCDAMAKQKFRPARLGGFSGTKAYIQYVEILKKRRNAAGRTFCDAIREDL
jgi:hypothetical protein